MGDQEQFQGPRKHQCALNVATALVRYVATVACPRITPRRRLIADATLADLTSMEELMTKLMQMRRMPTLVVDALWSIFGKLR